MLKKFTAAFLAVCMTAAIFAGCAPKNDISSGAGQQDYPVTIGTVSLNAPPTGVAVLSPNLADVILSLDYEIMLKAKSADCTQSDLSVLPNVTADDAKKIKSLGADLVLTDSFLTENQLKAMAQEGINVLKIDRATSREDLDRLYSQVGAALKGAKTGYERGKKISQSIFLTIDDISRIIPETNVVTTVAYLYDLNGGVATGDTLEGKLIESAGLVNAASDGTGNKMDFESLLRANPKYIFCPTGLKAKLAASPEYAKLSAVKEGKVYEMDPNEMLLQGRGMVEAVSYMAGIVYPELLKGTAPTSSSSGDTSSSSGTTSSSPESTSSGSTTYQTLKRNDQGADVLKMQNRLLELGYMFVKPSGLYAQATEQAVKDFQLLNGMEVTGIADPKTLELLYSGNAKKRNG
ncbi:MAG: peptidoglycan-binding protein [Ruminococcaceae bacterium]|jgi:ABC-type Fe3+-hydroxamate transport system substrate-binding protein|nr:peptidoglycan-binding protein [Oscillospiraceae bacterium]HHV31514.1 ABC transporter substrate-binding protein [Clostridiales bacterium]